jgi:hypothetical protein
VASAGVPLMATPPTDALQLDPRLAALYEIASMMNTV